MVRITRSSTTTNISRLIWLYRSLFAATCFSLMFLFASMDPTPAVPFQRPPPLQLATPNNTKITTDVRGNLGPPQVMIQGGNDWIKDRWQAASDMHGTAIKGAHQVLLSFHFPLEVDSIGLDWEAAFSKDYILEGAMSNLVWFTLYDTATEGNNVLDMGPVREEGQSPGVKTKTPLHIIHSFARHNSTTAEDHTGIPSPPRLQYFRLTIRSSAMGWGVSLWRIKIFGWPFVR